MEVRFVNEEFIKLINFLIVSKESLMVTSDNHFRHFVGLEVTWKRGAGYFDYIFFGLLPSHVTRTCLKKITPVLQVTLIIIIKKIGTTRISNYYKYTCGDLFIKFTATNRKMAWLSFANFVTIHINPLAW